MAEQAQEQQTPTTTEPQVPSTTTEPLPSSSAPPIEAPTSDKPARDRGPDGKFLPKDAPAEDKPATSAQEAAPDYSGLTIADGLTAVPEILDRFKATVGELKMPPAAAQQLLDLHAETLAAWNAAAQQERAQWREQLAADPELGGRNLGQTKSLYAKALDQLPNLRKVLDTYNLLDEPGTVRDLIKLGKTIREDTFVTGGVVRSNGLAATMYPNTPQMRD